MSNTINAITTKCLFAIALGLLLVSPTAHADFRKAVDAYIARDGATMLKEVKDAVDKKNDEGLMLLLMATNMDAATSDYDDTTKQSKSTLRAILPPPKWDEMRELLVQATNNGTVDAQYSFVKSAFGKDIVIKRLQEAQIKRGEKLKANYSLQETNQGYEAIEKEFTEKGLITNGSDMVKRAEGDDFQAQLSLGAAYLHYTGEYTGICAFNPNDVICKTKDEVKGIYWLNRAVKTYEREGLPYQINPDFSVAMCDFYQSKPSASQTDLRQAYLWCLFGFNSGSTNAPTILRKMDQTGKLKIAAPDWHEKIWKTGKYWNELQMSKVKEWPELLVAARQELIHEDLPVFSYEFKEDILYGLTVYSDGRVFLNPVSFTRPNVLMGKVKPEVIKRFLRELHKIGFDEWPLFSGGSACDMGCGFTQSSAMLRINNVPRRVTFFSDKMELASATKRLMMIREAKLKALVDTYFPTKQLRIELGSSEKLKSKFLAREAEWIELSKEKLTNKN